MAADWSGGSVTGRHPRHLKCPTPPGEELADALYNKMSDFFGLNIGVTRIGLLSFDPNEFP